MPPRKPSKNDEKNFWREFDKQEFVEETVAKADQLRSEGKLEQAIMAYRKALKKGPHYVPALLGLSESLRDSGRHRELIEFYAQSDREAQMIIVLDTAKSTSALQLYSETIRLIEDALRSEVSADYADYLYDELALAYEGIGDSVNATRARQKAEIAQMVYAAENIETQRLIVQMMPKEASVHAQLAELLAAIHDHCGAVEAIRKAIRLNPENSEYSRKLAEYKNRMRAKSKH